MKTLSSPFFSALVAFSCQQAGAVIVVQETFADGNRSGNNPPSSLEWNYGAHHATAASAFTSLTVAPNQLTWDHTISPGVNSFSAIWGHFTPSGSPLTLAVGETLRLTFTAAFSAPTDNANTGAFRFSLLNSGGSRINSDFAGTNTTGISSGSTFTNWRGYEGQTGVSTTGVANGSATRQRDGASPSAGLYVTGGTWSNVGSAINSPTSTAGVAQNGFLEITRTATGAIIQSGYGSAVTAATADNTGAFVSFDTISFFTLDQGNDITLSNIQLELIPEPSAILLGAAGLLPLALRRRRG